MVAKEGDRTAQEGSASELIDQKIAELGGWRGDTLARIRSIIRELTRMWWKK
ncbi:hypothetical protein QO002_001938 [Pararhizobium capsulatum DSM 1112]|uniref:Uncharacterized protein n=1 Tax=Pararhizobium capsulatum DSM 1112 TaxID=1121113 RepID=A0ABU0BNG2_9HYPH|nr:hypothetical protein [Pararhizobium capsulatum DSM 1112]